MILRNHLRSSHRKVSSLKSINHSLLSLREGLKEGSRTQKADYERLRCDNKKGDANASPFLFLPHDGLPTGGLNIDPPVFLAFSG